MTSRSLREEIEARVGVCDIGHEEIQLALMLWAARKALERAEVRMERCESDNPLCGCSRHRIAALRKELDDE